MFVLEILNLKIIESSWYAQHKILKPTLNIKILKTVAEIERNISKYSKFILYKPKSNLHFYY